MSLASHGEMQHCTTMKKEQYICFNIEQTVWKVAGLLLFFCQNTKLIEKYAKMNQMVYLQNIPEWVNESRHVKQLNLEIWSQKRF